MKNYYKREISYYISLALCLPKNLLNLCFTQLLVKFMVEKQTEIAYLILIAVWKREDHRLSQSYRKQLVDQ